MKIDEDFVELELSNIGEGKLDAQFRAAVDKAYHIFTNAGELGADYEVGKEKTLRCKVGMEVTFDFDLETRTLDIGSRVTKFTEPALRQTHRMGHMKAGVVLVEKVTQADLPLAPVRSIANGNEDGGEK